MKSEIVLDVNQVPTSEETTRLLLVKVTGGERKDAANAPPVNLSLVIDRSGSMKGEKLAYVKQAAHELVRRLRAEDTVSVVAYDDRIEVPLPPSKLNERDRVRAAIETLTARNMTNLSGGWLQGCQFVQEGAAKGQVDRVILLSDGLVNRGVTAIDQLKAMARSQRSDGITTTTMGVGMDYNEDLMRAMAEEGGGAYYFIDNPDQASAFFQQELSDLQQVAGQNLTITIEPGDTLRGVKQLNDYAMESHAGNMRYRLGDIYAGETRTQVFEIAVGPLKKGKTTVGKVHISYDSVSADSVDHFDLIREIDVQAVPAAKLKKQDANPDVVRAALFQRVARAHEKAITLADRRQFQRAAEVLREAAEMIKSSGIEDEVLQAEYRRLMEQAAQMDFGETSYDRHMRKLHHSRSHQMRRPVAYADMMEEQHFRHRYQNLAIERNGETPARLRVDGKEIVIRDNLVIIGSDPASTIRIDHKDVEARHCEIRIQKDSWILKDTMSRQGTFANGGLVRRDFKLSAGDIVTIGPALLEFE